MADTKPYSVSATQCSGCQACVELHPDLFAWDDQNERIVPLQDTANPETLQNACAYCPNDCIDIHDD